MYAKVYEHSIQTLLPYPQENNHKRPEVKYHSNCVKSPYVKFIQFSSAFKYTKGLVTVEEIRELEGSLGDKLNLYYSFCTFYFILHCSMEAAKLRVTALVSSRSLHFHIIVYSFHFFCLLLLSTLAFPLQLI